MISWHSRLQLLDYLITCRPQLIDSEEEEYLRMFHTTVKDMLTEEIAGSPLFSVHVVSTLMTRIRPFHGYGDDSEVLVSDSYY